MSKAFFKELPTLDEAGHCLSFTDELRSNPLDWMNGYFNFDLTLLPKIFSFSVRGISQIYLPFGTCLILSLIP